MVFLYVAGVHIAKPGCPDDCGGVKIPFPFGVQAGCYLDSLSQPDLYKINCDNSTGKPIPILASQTRSDENRSVLNIDLADHTLRVSNQVGFACYKDGKLQDNIPRFFYSFNAAPFANSAKNKLVAVGCDTSARVGDNDQTQEYFTGCMTSCLSPDDIPDGVCSGIGCCEAPIPAGIYMPYVKVESISNHRSVEKFNPCSFGFVSEPGGYNFSSAMLNYSASQFPQLRVSAMLDWAIFNGANCSDKKDSGNQLCGLNTQCVDLFLVFQTYRCICLPGYSGNPYLPNGCQDIDECSDAKLNDCNGPAQCVNKIGSYLCTCPIGYNGSGTANHPCLQQFTATSAHNKLIILGLSISLGSILVLLFLGGLYKGLKRRKDVKVREHNFNKNGGLLLQQQLCASEGAVERTKIFSHKELDKATDNFNNNRILGRGGQGTVYKGMLEDGTTVAVKKSKN